MHLLSFSQTTQAEKAIDVMRNEEIDGVPLIIKWDDGEKEMLDINEET